jgi:hypothetical protein
MSPPTTTRRTALWLGVAALLPACGHDEPDGPSVSEDAPARPGPDEVLLVIDGQRVMFGDIAEPVAHLDRLVPEYSERTKIAKALTEYVVPLLLARREFAAQREEQLQLARTVRASCSNVRELDARTQDRPRLHKRVSHADVDLPVASFLFDPARTGAASEPIEVPYGWVLAGAFDLESGSVPLRDACDALLVPFATHTDADFRAWLAALQARLADTVTFVHPDYRLAMPPWMKLP